MLGTVGRHVAMLLCYRLLIRTLAPFGASKLAGVFARKCNCIQNNVIIFIMYASRASMSCISAHNGIQMKINIHVQETAGVSQHITQLPIHL